MSGDPYEPSGLPLLLIQAAQSAAQADGLPPPPTGEAADVAKSGGPNGISSLSHPSPNLASSSTVTKEPSSIPVVNGPTAGLRGAAPHPSVGKKKGPPLRRGKWTPEEEAYANRLIQEFKAGLLPLTDGTTLRTFLSKLLNCDPMRISKKFVGSNCIGKQVFRRRTADINRLTPEQIQQSRAELSELERRFLERVAQTNRVKSSGVGGNATASSNTASAVGKVKEEPAEVTPSSPPWLQPPNGYKQGSGAAMAATNLSGSGSNGGAGDGGGVGGGDGSVGSGNGNRVDGVGRGDNGGGGNGGDSSNRAAAAGRALLQGLNAGSLKSSLDRKQQNSALASHGSAGLFAMAELQRRASQQSLLQNTLGNSASNLLAAAAAARTGSSSAMAQLARSASAARMAGLASGSSMNNLMLKTGLSRDQLSQLARDRGLSSASLSNMIERQNSFDALMSLDFQSLQSIDNLANLIQTGAGQTGGLEGGMKNWSADASLSASRSNLAAAASTGNLSNAARRLASAGRMESLLRSLSGNLGNNGSGGDGGASSGSSANINNLLQSMQSNLGNLGNGGNSASSLIGSGSGNPSASAVSLANLLRPDSSTGLTALRMQEGLNQRNSSVEDFLSLVAAGDIPHQDPSTLNISLMQQQAAAQSDPQSAAAILAQRQLLAQARNQSIGNLGSFSGSLNNMSHSSSAAALALAQARASEHSQSSNSMKRKLLDLEGEFDGQGTSKR